MGCICLNATIRKRWETGRIKSGLPGKEPHRNGGVHAWTSEKRSPYGFTEPYGLLV